MAPRVKKIRRPRNDGELVIEQTRDLERVAAMLGATGLSTAGIERPGHCYLIASVGARPVGVAGVATRIDVAVVDALAVIVEIRRHGIGTALLAAARAAAHTRGARALYALAPPATGEFFQRYGFVAVAMTSATAALAATFVADHLLASFVESGGCTAWFLDISRDGLVLR